MIASLDYITLPQLFIASTIRLFAKMGTKHPAYPIKEKLVIQNKKPLSGFIRVSVCLRRRPRR